MPFDLSRSLPNAAPALRPARPADLPRLTDWINRGRREGRFAGPPEVTSASLKRYFAGLARAGQQHRCLIVEQGKKPIGYTNFVASGRHGELLGVYLEPSARGTRLGPYLIRRAAAELRTLGCREVSAKVFHDNLPSLRACAAAGLTERSRDISLGTQRGWIVRRKLAPLRATTPRFASYARLAGNNLYLHHLTLADALTSAFAELPGVEAVFGLGSLARGFGDAFSDLDLGLLGRGLGRLPWRGERWFCGVSVDLYAVDLDCVKVSAWDATRKQAFEESVLLHATPRFRLDPFRNAIGLGRTERREAICELVFKIGWLGFEPKRWFGRLARNYQWALPHDLWIQRGSLASAHLTVDRVCDFVFELLFLLNAKRPPDPKWRRFLLADLPWLPPRHTELLGAIERGARTRKGFDLRAAALLSLVDGVVRELERRNDLADDMYEMLLRIAHEYRSDV